MAPGKKREEEGSSRGTAGLKVLGYKAAQHRQRTGQGQCEWRARGGAVIGAEDSKLDEGLSDRLWILP